MASRPLRLPHRNESTRDHQGTTMPIIQDRPVTTSQRTSLSAAGPLGLCVKNLERAEKDVGSEKHIKEVTFRSISHDKVLTNGYCYCPLGTAAEGDTKVDYDAMYFYENDYTYK